MENTYDKTFQVELDSLENKLRCAQNYMIDLFNIKEELWGYHPNNKKFINPIKEYDNTLSKISRLEEHINTIESDISHLKSAH